MANYGVYATMDEVKEYLQGRSASNLIGDDQRIKRFCIEASRRFDEYCKRRFYPALQTRYFDHPASGSSGYTTTGTGIYPPTTPTAVYTATDQLRLDDDLLQLTAFTTDNGDTALSASDYYLMTGCSYNEPPYDRIAIRSDSSAALSYSDTPQRANAVSGLWGFHDDWANAWAAVDTVQNNPLSSSATSLTVASADGPDEQGLSPRLQIQQLIRFGSSASAEYAYISGKSGNTLTIIRGVNGTTAAEQALNTVVYVYRPMWQIVQAVKILAAHSYRRKDSVGNSEDRALASPTGVILMPSTLPNEVTDMLRAYKRAAIW